VRIITCFVHCYQLYLLNSRVVIYSIVMSLLNSVYFYFLHVRVQCCIRTHITFLFWHALSRTSSGVYAAYHLSSSSSVLCCFFHLYPTVPEVCHPHLLFQISFPGVLVSLSSCVAVQCPVCSDCLALPSSLPHNMCFKSVSYFFEFWRKLLWNCHKHPTKK